MLKHKKLLSQRIANTVSDSCNTASGYRSCLVSKTLNCTRDHYAFEYVIAYMKWKIVYNRFGMNPSRNPSNDRVPDHRYSPSLSVMSSGKPHCIRLMDILISGHWKPKRRVVRPEAQQVFALRILNRGTAKCLIFFFFYFFSSFFNIHG